MGLPVIHDSCHQESTLQLWTEVVYITLLMNIAADNKAQETLNTSPIKIIKVYTLKRNNMRMDNNICFILFFCLILLS